VLKKLGLYDGLVRGELKRAIRGRLLNLGNLGGLHREDGEVKLVCSRIKCLVETAWRVGLNRRPRAW